MFDAKPMQTDKTEPSAFETIIIIIAFIIVAAGFAYAIVTPRSVFGGDSQPSSAQSITPASIESTLNLH